MTILFTGDTHFGHKGILKYTDRSWAEGDVSKMDNMLIHMWNLAVAQDDHVWHLGDFAFAGMSRIMDILDRLNGHIHLIRSNYDKVMTKRVRDRFESVHDRVRVEVKDPDAPGGVQHIVLCHLPLVTWNMAHYGAWHLHGHCHGKLEPMKGGRVLDVGVDALFTPRPVSYEIVKELMRDKR